MPRITPVWRFCRAPVRGVYEETPLAVCRFVNNMLGCGPAHSLSGRNQAKRGW